MECFVLKYEVMLNKYLYFQYSNITSILKYIYLRIFLNGGLLLIEYYSIKVWST